MALSDAILTRLLSLHPKIIDLVARPDAAHSWQSSAIPSAMLPPVIHVAGTNGKGSTVAYLRAIMEAAGLAVHAYTSPHLVKFHERIRVAGELISEPNLSALLEECEAANGGEPITFFEITTAAAFLAFSRTPADYLILEVGLGGRLDATNVIDAPRLSVITAIDYDHQQYLGDTLTAIAHEKAGILKRGVPADHRRAARRGACRNRARGARACGAPLAIANQDWQSFEQHGRLVFQDEHGLLDLPLPQLRGPPPDRQCRQRHRRHPRPGRSAHHRGPHRRRPEVRHMARPHAAPGAGRPVAHVPAEAELWLDGGHNPVRRPGAGPGLLRSERPPFAPPGADLGHAQHQGHRQDSSPVSQVLPIA